MFGGAPGIRKGESSMSSRGYSYLRAAAVAGASLLVGASVAVAGIDAKDMRPQKV